MEWEYTLLIALVTLIVTRIIDYFTAIFSEKRDFKKRIKILTFEEIEKLKNDLGELYEITSNWKSFDEKEREYAEQFAKESRTIGKYNKYPIIAMSARDVIHYCKIVMDIEQNNKDGKIQAKQELADKFAIFINECNVHLENKI